MEEISQNAGNGYDAGRHLGVVRSLCDAVREAYAALAANRLDEFRHLSAQQDELCARLAAALPRTVSDKLHTDGVSVPIRSEVRAAHLELAHFTLRLSALLRRNRRSIDLLDENRRFFVGASGHFVASASAQHSWSSEA